MGFFQPAPSSRRHGLHRRFSFRAGVGAAPAPDYDDSKYGPDDVPGGKETLPALDRLLDLRAPRGSLFLLAFSVLQEQHVALRTFSHQPLQTLLRVAHLRNKGQIELFLKRTNTLSTMTLSLN